MNIWHGMSPKRITTERFSAVIEIPQRSKIKYELDKSTGFIMVDRILYTSTHYPANYGFIPRTYCEDDDPLDVVVICSEPLYPLSIIDCYPIGVISMTDGGDKDDKIIAIPFNEPLYNCYKEIDELPSHIFEEMCHFFEVYKSLEHKNTTITEVKGSATAKEIIQKAINDYIETFQLG